MSGIRKIIVKCHDRVVGTLAETTQHEFAFQYDASWLRGGFSISPISLPLDNEVRIPKTDQLEGLFGVFADSLPDGWGRLLVDRMLRANGKKPESVTALERLAIVGKSGMGALEYYPQMMEHDSIVVKDYDILSKECERILREEQVDNLDELFQLGGSSGGARPKALIEREGAPWIVKFATAYDPENIGLQEYQYMNCAKKCGINIPEVELLPSKISDGYYAVKRFDRINGKKVHMVTASGLLETSHRVPNLDYVDLMKLTYLMTKDEQQLIELYRRMCFNVFSNNRDDHSKNFTYLYNEEMNCWELSPAYDLTYSSSVGGEHATTVAGNGSDPGMKDILKVANEIGITKKNAQKIARDIQQIVYAKLNNITE